MPIIKKGMDTSSIKKIITALLVSLLAAIAVSALCAILVSKGVIGEEGEQTCSALALVIGAAAGGAYLAGCKGERYLVTSLFNGLVFFVARFGLGLLCGGRSELSAAEAAACMLVGGVLGGIVRIKKRRRK